MPQASEPLRTFPRIDPNVEGAVRDWRPRNGPRPAVELEPRDDGLRVKLIYLGVESGVLFAWGEPTNPTVVQSTLDRVYDVLSWRVIKAPA